MKEARRELESVYDKLTEIQRNIAQIILEIPSGKIASYRCIALIYKRRHGRELVPLVVAQTRIRLYELLTHNTKVPLHRMATQNDLHSANDSGETKWYNKVLRGREGTYDYDNPDNAWWEG